MKLFGDLFQRPPSALRRRAPASRRALKQGSRCGCVIGRPMTWDSMLSYLRARATPMLKRWRWVYRRTVEIDGFIGSVEVALAQGKA